MLLWMNIFRNFEKHSDVNTGKEPIYNDKCFSTCHVVMAGLTRHPLNTVNHLFSTNQRLGINAY
jgi:hypothetical protein